MLKMLTIYLNGNKLILENNMLLHEILQNNGFENSNFAVAINRKFIPRSAYMQTQINDGDQIDIVTPMQGG